MTLSFKQTHEPFDYSIHQTLNFYSKGLKAMTFKNEIVSEADIAKYGLDEIKKEFNPYSWTNGRPEGFWHVWTIDRERDVYLMQVEMVEECGPSGRPEPTSKYIFILNIQGKRVRVLLKRVRCPKSFSDIPFIIGWSLIEIDLPKTFSLHRDDVIQLLKDALTTYGYRGAYSEQSPNTIIEFN